VPTEIRPLTPDTVSQLERFSDAFDNPLDDRSTERFLADRGHHLLLAYLDDEPAGFVSAVEIHHPDKPTERFLNELSVVEHARRRGVATALLEALKGLATERGASLIWVLTDEANEAGMATYRAAGGTWNGEHAVMFDIPPDDGR
jgi:ribosomal protein S18 acetylase RimI-like enzyme